MQIFALRNLRPKLNSQSLNTSFAITQGLAPSTTSLKHEALPMQRLECKNPGNQQQISNQEKTLTALIPSQQTSYFPIHHYS